ncbi:MAG: HNH endonuclease [Planctomycetota bacterium]
MVGGFTREIRKWLNGIIYTVYLVYCRFRFGKNVCLIDLKRFKFAIVDKEDYDRLRKRSWRCRRFDDCWYAVRWVRASEKSNKTVAWMHRAVLEAPEGTLVDHKNHNGLDNRKDNLRLATYSQNMQNRRKIRRACSSRFKGVMFRKEVHRRRRWRGSIKVGGWMIELGMFKTEVEAARAYDAAAKKHFGEFACLNFPES